MKYVVLYNKELRVYISEAVYDRLQLWFSTTFAPISIKIGSGRIQWNEVYLDTVLELLLKEVGFE